MSGLPFVKMHGLGNDFVVLDARAREIALGPSQARAIADRRTGVGCDQILVIEPARNGSADAFMRILNADGGEVAACGNGTRCVAALLMRERGKDHAVIETEAGLLEARALGPGLVAADIGPARLEWHRIPLAREVDTLHVDIGVGPFAEAVAVNVGNPHAVFFVADAEAAPLEAHGRVIEHMALFPGRTNVEAVELRSRRSLRVRVWERGVGITRACGTGACAAVVAASARGLAERTCDVFLDGGTLAVTWREDGHVVMSGAIAESFTGTLAEGLPA